MSNQELTRKFLRSVLDYDPETGLWRWIGKRGNARYRDGWFLGSISAQGFPVINLLNSPRLCHRLAFLWMTGKIPDGEIVQINGVRTDNRWANLAQRSDLPEETLTAEYLRSNLLYDPATGLWQWLRQGRKRRVGEWFAGTLSGNGYRLIGLCGKRNLAHRLAWLYMTGTIPKELDHVNGNRSDNRFVNLRIATRSQNGMNKNPAKHNTSGYKGVWWHGQSKRWAATIYVDKKRINLGMFETKELAAAAYADAAAKYHGKFARSD